MAVDLKDYQFLKGKDRVLDGEFASTKTYSKVKPGKTALFWKAGLRWYHISYREIQRIYRQKEPVFRRICCGGMSFYIERLVLILKDGTDLVIHVGDNVDKEGEILLQYLKETHPELEYGKKV